jgi:dolichyl-phosphate beta-glucosyltransferase
MSQAAGRAIMVIPCFNEAARLPIHQVGVLLAFCDVLFVDDGSTDNTVEILHRIESATGPTQCRVLRMPRNVGKGEAVRTGMLEALQWAEADQRTAIIGYTDADFATPPAELKRLLAMIQDNDALYAVIGSRMLRLGAEIERNTMRHYLGRVFATAASHAIEAPVYDSQCGAKWFRHGAELRESLSTPFRSRWAFDVELLSRLTRRGLSFHAGATKLIREEPLNEWMDVAGSKVKPVAALKAGLDLLWIAIDHRRGKG